MRFFKRFYDISYFNTWVEKLPLDKVYIRQKVDLIRSLKSSGRLLEIGCGNGELLKSLKKFYSVSGVDISHSAITETSKHINKKHLKVMDIEKKNISGKYDIILAFDLLEHLRNPRKAIKKIKRTLNKDGIFIFSVPNKYGLYGRLATGFFNFVDKTHISTYERSRWIGLMEKEGFKLDVRNQSMFGIIKSGIGKFISFNLFVIAKKTG